MLNWPYWKNGGLIREMSVSQRNLCFKIVSLENHQGIHIFTSYIQPRVSSLAGARLSQQPRHQGVLEESGAHPARGGVVFRFVAVPEFLNITIIAKLIANLNSSAIY